MKKVLFVALLASVALSAAAKKKLAITMTGENLATLTQVTDNQEPCLDPYGGDNGAALFFTVRENGKYYNIYKKDNPFSAAMSQKTSGKNYNRTPCFNPATGKLAFSCKQDGASSADIYTMFDSKGKALSQITESTDAYEEYPSFNKEGNLLVYDKVQRSYYAPVRDNRVFNTIRRLDASKEVAKAYAENMPQTETKLLFLDK